MKLEDSLLSSVKLRSKPQRFLTLLGVTSAQFDEIFEQFYDLHVRNQVKRNCLEPADRVERRIARHRSSLREHLCITLLYLRQYNTQEILAASFDLSQGQISKIINRTTVLLEVILPVPEKISQLVLNYLKTLDVSTRKMYKATLIVDASEQRIERNQDQKRQRVDYSGKKSVIAENFR
jgi:hypothetical protein